MDNSNNLNNLNNLNQDYFDYYNAESEYVCTISDEEMKIILSSITDETKQKFKKSQLNIYDAISNLGYIEHVEMLKRLNELNEVCEKYKI